MATIDFASAQIIVENAMRANNFGGTLTIGDQKINLETSWTNANPINYQVLRDSIAKSIVDALTAVAVAGEISTGTTTAPNGQQITTSSNVNINSVGNQGAARLGDSTMVTALSDPVFIAWVASVSSALSIPTPPISISGKITSASSSVNIGN
jgi:hypothetical protein